MKLNNILLSVVAMSMIAFSGCYRPFHEKVYVDVGTSEIAILVKTIDDNGQAIIAPPTKVSENQDGSVSAEGKSQVNSEAINYYSKRVVNARKIEIPYYWKNTGYVWFYEGSGNGKYVPGARCITINTAPETSEWSKDKNNAIWVESRDSVGFSTGISITARIQDKTDAIVFLANYPPKNRREVEMKDGTNFIVEVTSLEQIMNEEIRIKIQEVYADECTVYPMDELREKKKEVMTAVRNVVKPFFKERGITITTIGQFGGFEYENGKIQDAIDEVFTAQQDRQVAKAETQAAQERKEALKLMGEGEGSRILEKQIKEAEGIKAIADAKAYELEQLQKNQEGYLTLKRLEIDMARLNRWDGKYPTYLFQTGGDGAEVPQLLLSTPNPPKK